ncbi:MAG TPA: hypothetical protein DCZ01_11110 [Elusimicrobia bacterium]|nr:MAG: hypothetical protein A2X37_02100 [Elusimicrobia bacterium GWA2_66_18]OGR68419.1 MAG: hypothetical protein A2X40_09865 [Elusimicrobia bacterium GWC2_65_9]HAZ09040.1 hypothetical protein [Elusimicrobiota bacterium]
MDKRGQACEGSANAANLAALTEMLRLQNQFLISVSVVSDKKEPAQAPVAQAPRVARMGRRHAVSDVDVAIVNNQLSLMIRAAIPILDALTTVVSQQSNPALRETLQSVADAVRGGSSLTAAFGRHPDVFDNVYLSLLEAGEASGTLPKMLERIRSYLEFKVGVRTRIHSAMVYPAVVLGTAFLVVLGLIIFVLPTFAEVFEQFDAPLPISTKFLIWLSGAMRAHWVIWMGGAAVAIAGARAWLKAERNRLLVHTLMLTAPFAGKLVRCIVLSRVMRTLGELLGANVPILKSLDLCEATAGNEVIARVIRHMRTQVESGQNLWPSLAASDYIPEMVAHVVAGAEKSGRLPEALAFIADYYQAEVDVAMRNFFAALEPMFVVFLGVIIGGIAISMLIPIFQLGGVVQ